MSAEVSPRSCDSDACRQVYDKCREIRYRTIADDLRRRIGEGELAGGRVLPSESELSASYAASRITVRRALDVLRDEGLVDSRQGFGWFVARDPLRQSLVRLGTIEAQLADAGLRAERRVLDFGFVPAPERAREVIGADIVLEVRRLTLADDVPFARVTVWCPEAIGARLSRDDVERATSTRSSMSSSAAPLSRSPRLPALGRTLSCSACALVHPCCAANGSREQSQATRCCSASTSSPPIAPSWSSSCPSAIVRSRRPGSVLWSDRQPGNLEDAGAAAGDVVAATGTEGQGG